MGDCLYLMVLEYGYRNDNLDYRDLYINLKLKYDALIKTFKEVKEI